MAAKDQIEKPEDQKPVFTESETDRMLQTLQLIYALDDAISNQQKLQRPAGFVQPLMNLREVYGHELQDLASRGKNRNKKPEPAP